MVVSRQRALPVIALTILAGALRVYGIGHQGLWFDEAYTVMLVKLPFGSMLHTVSRTESTPYLYYILAWATVPSASARCQRCSALRLYRSPISRRRSSGAAAAARWSWPRWRPSTRC